MSKLRMLAPLLVVLALLVLLAWGLSFVRGHAKGSANTTHLTLLAPHAVPYLKDDLEFAGLLQALDRQLSAFQTGGAQDEVRLGGQVYTDDDVVTSAARFKSILEELKSCQDRAPDLRGKRQCLDAFNATVRRDFQVYRIKGERGQGALLTAYYTPTLEVSEVKDGAYRFPIYRLPTPPHQRYTRWEIDFQGVLDGQGYELFYAKDRFDVYVIHVEGGARVKVHKADGSIYHTYLSYAGDNGRAFQPIEHYLLQEGMLSMGQTSRYEQRRYLTAHPERQEAVYSSCPSYVYFQRTRTPPLGSEGAPLTPNRSIATDPRFYPVKGLIGYVLADLPQKPAHGPLDANPLQVKYTPMSRFFVDQDVGSAVQGRARADLYFGEDDDALFLANNFKTYGELYFFILK